MTVWDELVGQPAAVDSLRVAVVDAQAEIPGPAMTHAWLITGPPGSGRSTAARAFAAALMCKDGGCGHCPECQGVAVGSHPDVEVIRPEGVTYKTADARALVARASMAPSRGQWHVIVLEDADRLTETANNVLLKAIEEPPPRAVWLLCTPSVEDVLPTIRSRCRHIMLKTPAPEDVADYLVTAEGVDSATALFAAHASQGHVGRARALARDESARHRRRDILSIPARLTDLRNCFSSAEAMVSNTKEDARAITEPLNDREREDLLLAWGEGAQGRGVKGGARGVKGALKELEDRQKSRATRTQRDQLDRALLDLLGFYRDVLAEQFGATDDAAIGFINAEMSTEIRRVAADSTAIETVWRIDAIERARLALDANVAPQLAIEALTIDLRRPDLRRSAS